MRWIAPVLAALCLPAFAWAAGAGDPLGSAECGQAQGELHVALDEAARKEPGAAARLEQVRARAIQVCLGPGARQASTQQRSGAPERPIAVAPTYIGPRVENPKPSLQPAPPPVQVPRPATITSCDPAGCWDSEGRRLNSVGPNLVGPRGACTVQGAVVACP